MSLSSEDDSPIRPSQGSTSMPNLGEHIVRHSEEDGNGIQPSQVNDGAAWEAPAVPGRLTRAVTDAEGVRMVFPVRRPTGEKTLDDFDEVGQQDHQTSELKPSENSHGKPRFHIKDVARSIIRMMRVTRRFQTKLCSTCVALQISLKKFIIQDHASDPTQKAYRSYLRSTRTASSAPFARGAGSGKFRLGTLATIQGKSQTCPLCRLVVDSLMVFHEQDLFEGKLGDAECLASWQVDGREVVRDEHNNIVESRPRTRRIQLRWNNPGIEDSYLVLIAPEQRRQHEFDPQAPWSFNTLFLGRNIASAGNNQALAKLWLDTCSKYHGQVCQPTGGSLFDAMVSGAFFGAIDVHEMKLTALGPGQPYAALSYVWGKSKHAYKTLLSTIQIRQNPGELGKIIGILPQVIQDAIELVRGLGMKFLWVDSLCIVQDSNKSWELNSSVMDLVFGNAHLTICAADGDDAFEGLQGISKGRVVSQQSQPVLDNVRLMVSHLAETYVQRSKWNTRAWTFQERLLSKRCLIFAGKRMFYQCRCAAMSEDIVAEQQSAGWSIELVQAPLQMLHSLGSKPFWLYMECVKLYTVRELTRSGDILAAFMGMSNLLGRHLGAPLIFGLPSSHFDLALLWEPVQKCTRRKLDDRTDDVEVPIDTESIKLQQSSGPGVRGRQNTQNTDGISNLQVSSGAAQTPSNQQSNLHPLASLPPDIISKLKRLEQLENKMQKDMRGSAFPSWSWCGWEGSMMEYRADTIAGCLEDVQQWHARHTWINWYIRDSKGNLRLVWDRSSTPAQEANAKPHHNWLGYYFPSDGNATVMDDYGRELPDDLRRQTRNLFSRTLPEYPYKISLTGARSSGEHDQHQLQFWTWSAYLRINPHEQSENYNLGQGLDRYDILDYTGDWCGTIVLDDPWDGIPGSEHEFIAISEAKGFSKDESDNWSYYIPQDRSQSDWSLYYVLLIKRQKGIASRLGLGKVFKTAFDNSCLPGKEWREIILE